MIRASAIVAVAMLASGLVCAAEPIDFAKSIRPIFKQNCYECHGPGKRESGLRLDQRQEALAGGNSGPAILPSDPEGSLLLKLVQSDDPEKIMPPKGDPLSQADIELLKNWIEAGAQWPED